MNYSRKPPMGDPKDPESEQPLLKCCRMLNENNLEHSNLNSTIPEKQQKTSTIESLQKDQLC